MNGKQKQIEEMAKELSPYGFCKITICENCNRKKTSKCRYYSFAKRYTIKGYRKQSDTVREFVEKIEEVALQMRYEASRVYQTRNQSRAQFAFGEKNAIENLMEQINALAAEYGTEVKE